MEARIARHKQSWFHCMKSFFVVHDDNCVGWSSFGNLHVTTHFVREHAWARDKATVHHVIVRHVLSLLILVVALVCLSTIPHAQYFV